MPGEEPVMGTGFKSGIGLTIVVGTREKILPLISCARMLSRILISLRLFKSSIPATFGGLAILIWGSIHANAQSESASILPVVNLNMSAILMLAVFGGAMSFALLSAFWMIRERSRIVDENKKLKLTLSDSRAANDRFEALINSPGQRIAVWDLSDQEPSVQGDLGEVEGVPADDEEFLNFSQWLDSHSFSQFEHLIEALRSEAIGFNVTLKTKEHGLLEVHGNTSGSLASVSYTHLTLPTTPYV